MTHLRINIWLHNSVTVSESNQYLINHSLKALSTKSAVFYSALTSFGCLVNLGLMCPFRPQRQLCLDQSLSSCYFFDSFAHNFRNHFLTIHPVRSVPICMTAVDVSFSKCFDTEAVLLKGTMVLLLRSWISPSGGWTYDLLLAQISNLFSSTRCEHLVTVSVTITIHLTASHHQSSVTFVNFCSPPQTHTQSFMMLRTMCPVNTANNFQQRLV